MNENPYGNGTAIFTRDGGAARQFQFEVQAGMVGINVPIPVPVAYYSFGGWKASCSSATGTSTGPRGSISTRARRSSPRAGPTRPRRRSTSASRRSQPLTRWRLRGVRRARARRRNRALDELPAAGFADESVVLDDDVPAHEDDFPASPAPPCPRRGCSPTASGGSRPRSSPASPDRRRRDRRRSRRRPCPCAGRGRTAWPGSSRAARPSGSARCAPSRTPNSWIICSRFSSPGPPFGIWGSRSDPASFCPLKR